MHKQLNLIIMKLKWNYKVKLLLCGIISLCLMGAGTNLYGKEKKKEGDGEVEEKTETNIYKGLKWRSIGPAMTSGRIADFAVNPENYSEWYVAVASGNVWKTVNNGTTFKPAMMNNK